MLHMRYHRIIAVWAAAALTAALTACGASSGGSSTSTAETAVETVKAAEARQTTAAETSAAELTSAETSAAEPAAETSTVHVPEEISPETLSAVEGIDIDLTAMSATMVYAEVYDMLVQPQNYEGKTVRMNGTSISMVDEAAGKTYYACIIQDATACCSQGIEYLLPEEQDAPENYPEDGEEITVTGVFTTYMEDNYLYCTLKGASLE